MHHYDDMNRCLRCGHEWQGRTNDSPVQCPKCKSPRWNVAAKVSQNNAHALVRQAITQGLLPALDGSIACIDCGAPATVYEHRDYAKPLDVDPTCKRCDILRGPPANNHINPRMPQIGLTLTDEELTDLKHEALDRQLTLVQHLAEIIRQRSKDNGT